MSIELRAQPAAGIRFCWPPRTIAWARAPSRTLRRSTGRGEGRSSTPGPRRARPDRPESACRLLAVGP
eukprot:9961631-Alexandrium_andersonii.AAC.1